MIVDNLGTELTLPLNDALRQPQENPFMGHECVLKKCCKKYKKGKRCKKCPD